ncbi:MAG TPA: hypothetical protein VL200_07405 [Lacunisphaera sp.]|jgi:hypothetical protein|nr:hypothetical protein [Lacunisphaera sp.]
MKFSELLHQRDVLLRQARLANLAFAYEWLRDFARRARRARVRGVLTLRDGDPVGGEPWPVLVADEMNPSVLAEHFLDEDVVELADILAYVHDGVRPEERHFRLDELEGTIIPALRRELEGAGVPPQGSVAPEGNGVDD